MQYENINHKIDELVNFLRQSKEDRNQNRIEAKRNNPSKSMRSQIFLKTEGKCHICGGALDDKWHADHVLPHASGGKDTVENFLGSCWVCNMARWYFSPDEIKLILKLGRMVQAEIRKNTSLGRSIAKKYITAEEQKENRRAKRKK
jgi:hypothetical protein